MIVKLDDSGICFPDGEVVAAVEKALAEQTDFHTANNLAITVMRSKLFQMPVEKRPVIEWIFYGKVVSFDQDLRSDDAQSDPRTNILEDALFKLLS